MRMEPSRHSSSGRNGSRRQGGQVHPKPAHPPRLGCLQLPSSAFKCSPFKLCTSRIGNEFRWERMSAGERFCFANAVQRVEAAKPSPSTMTAMASPPPLPFNSASVTMPWKLAIGDNNARYGTCTGQHAGGLGHRRSGFRCEAWFERRKSRSAILRIRRKLQWQQRVLLPQRQPEAFEEEALGANSVARPSNAFTAAKSPLPQASSTWVAWPPTDELSLFVDHVTWSG
jgi:hypothetical protein